MECLQPLFPDSRLTPSHEYVHNWLNFKPTHAYQVFLFLVSLSPNQPYLSTLSQLGLPPTALDHIHHSLPHNNGSTKSPRLYSSILPTWHSLERGSFIPYLVPFGGKKCGLGSEKVRWFFVGSVFVANSWIGWPDWVANALPSDASCVAVTGGQIEISDCHCQTGRSDWAYVFQFTLALPILWIRFMMLFFHRLSSLFATSMILGSRLFFLRGSTS